MTNRRLKHLAIRAVLDVVEKLDLGAAFPGAAGRGVIFTLHHVRPANHQPFQPNALLEITPEFLELVISSVRQAGYETVRLENVPKLLADPMRSQKFACFTLDDGNRDNAEFASPVFRKHEAPYTIFICPGFIERSRTMWWQTVAALLQKLPAIEFDFGRGLRVLYTSSIAEKQSAYDAFATFVQSIDEDEAVSRIDTLARSLGIDPLQIVNDNIMTAKELHEIATDPLLSLGGHTMTHVNLARSSDQRLAMEIAKSCQAIEKYSHRPVATFAYPYGWKRATGHRVFNAAKAAGVTVGVTTQPGVLKTESLQHLTALPRISLNGYYQKPHYVKSLMSGIPFWLSR